MRSTLLVLTLVAAGCSSSGDGGTQPGPTPAISISLSPTSATVPQGGSATVDVTITRSGGFTGTVAVLVTGVPAGVTGTIGASQTSGGVTTATVTVDVAAGTAVGTYTLTVQGSGSGVSTASATYTLTVTAAAGYTLTPTPAVISVAQGGTGSVTVGITRSGFPGNVTLAAQNLPAGVSASFAPNPAGGNTSTMTLTATAGAALGAATITIRGTATGLADRTTTVSLTVTAGTGGSGSVVIDFSNCALIGAPAIWFAYQDGNGAWTRVTGAANVYRFDVSQAKASIAWTLGSGVSIWFMTRAELTAGTIQACEVPGTKRVNGTLTGVGPGQSTHLNIGNSSSTTPVGPNWMVERVRNGAQDLVAYRATQGTPRVNERGFVRRDLDIPNNGSAGGVDFNGAESFAPLTATVTVNGTAGDDVLVTGMNYLTTAGCAFGVLHSTQNVTSPFTTAGFPAANQRATDFHVLAVTGNSPTLGSRSVQHSFNALTNKTVTLPPTLPTPAVTVLAGPYRRLQAATTSSLEYDSHTQFVYWQGVGNLPMSMLATAGWLAGTAVTLAFPDLAGVAGWNPAWAPPLGAGGSWTMLAAGKTMGFGGNQCVEGGVVKSAIRNGTH